MDGPFVLRTGTATAFDPLSSDGSTNCSNCPLLEIPVDQVDSVPRRNVRGGELNESCAAAGPSPLAAPFASPEF